MEPQGREIDGAGSGGAKALRVPLSFLLPRSGESGLGFALNDFTVKGKNPPPVRFSLLHVKPL
jgi:hypothetical protein